MSFIYDNTTVVSFADFQDVYDKDQRLFDANEGLTDDIIEAQLIRATERLLTKIRSTDWWRNYYVKRSTSSYLTVADIPAVDPNLIKDRQNDFRDLCIYIAMSDYILPIVADFGNDDDAERKKMGYYTQKAEEMFGELITAGDWYDFDDDDTIASAEKEPGFFNLKRVR